MAPAAAVTATTTTLASARSRSVRPDKQAHDEGQHKQRIHVFGSKECRSRPGRGATSRRDVGSPPIIGRPCAMGFTAAMRGSASSGHYWLRNSHGYGQGDEAVGRREKRPRRLNRGPNCFNGIADAAGSVARSATAPQVGHRFALCRERFSQVLPSGHVRDLHRRGDFL